MNTLSPSDPNTILQNVIYSTIATTNADGSPWSSPVFSVYDPSTQSVHWCSAQESQHSQNIERTGQVFIAVYDSMAAPGQGWGVYLQGTAHEVTGLDAITHAHTLLTAKHKTPYWTIQDIHSPAPIRLYTAKIPQAWVNQARLENGCYINDRLAITL